MTDFKNEFSWSKSRDELFKECQRKYYYNHYAFWGGWDKNIDSRTREIYILKQLQGMPMWLGDKVHSAVELSLKAVLKQDSLPAKQQIISQMTEEMERDFRQSKAGLYRRNPKYYQGFFEHEYKRNIDQTKWQALYRNAITCIDNYYKSPIVTEALELGSKNWMPIEDRASFDFHNIKVYIKIDFAYRRDNQLIIVDWKTGKTEDVDIGIQLGCYALYAIRKWNARINKISALVCNLLTNRVQKTEMIEAHINEVEFRISTSIDAMKKKLLDEKENIPLPEEQFPKTDNQRSCNYCNFQKICNVPMS